MINFDDHANENNGVVFKTVQELRSHNLKWHYIQDHPYKILIIGGSGSGKANALLNLINNKLDIHKIYLYAKDPYEPKYQFLINKRKSTGLNHFNDAKAFIEYSSDMQNVSKNIDHYNADKERKILILFDNMTADMINKKTLNSIVTELFIRGRKLNISLFLSHNHISRFQKMLILLTFLLSKFQIKEIFNKLH